ncbi:MAG: YdeI/OmpD-associated family protein, partial [Burkholderiales bacterium]
VEHAMDKNTNTSRMKRDIHEMPEDVRDALKKAKAVDAYNGRPAYQQNDYVGWITRAKLPATRQKRIDQMLDELKSGGVYMKMKWNG